MIRKKSLGAFYRAVSAARILGDLPFYDSAGMGKSVGSSEGKVAKHFQVKKKRERRGVKVRVLQLEDKKRQLRS